MALQLGNRVKESTSTTGTGTLDLGGAASGFNAFSDEITSGNTVSYLITDGNEPPTDWEHGTGTFTTGTPDTLSRDTVHTSSNGGSKVAFSAGTKTVIASPSAADLVLGGANNTFSGNNIFTGDNDLSAGTTTLGTVAGNVDFTGDIKKNGNDLVPTGVLQMWAGNSTGAPSGWLVCDGREVSRTTYSALHALLKDVGGTDAYAYGNGNGSTTFNLPDFRGRSPLGVNDSDLPGGTSGSFSTRNEGDTGGNETHTLTTSEMPGHTHGPGSLAGSTSSDGGHNGHNSTSGGTGNPQTGGGSWDFQDNKGAHTHTITVDSGNTASSGGDTAHTIMHPFAAINFIIKT